MGSRCGRTCCRPSQQPQSPSSSAATAIAQRDAVSKRSGAQATCVSLSLAIVQWRIPRKVHLVMHMLWPWPGSAWYMPVWAYGRQLRPPWPHSDLEGIRAAVTWRCGGGPPTGHPRGGWGCDGWPPTGIAPAAALLCKAGWGSPHGKRRGDITKAQGMPHRPGADPPHAPPLKARRCTWRACDDSARLQAAPSFRSAHSAAHQFHMKHSSC